MQKDVNIGVVHQRVASRTAQLYKHGDYQASSAYNDQWANYLDKTEEFQVPSMKQKQEVFKTRNKRLTDSIQNKFEKQLISEKGEEIEVMEKIEEEVEES